MIDKINFPRYITSLLLLIYSLVANSQADSLYNLAIKKADASFDFKWSSEHEDHNPVNKFKFEISKDLYLKALEIKPNEFYPVNRIKEIDQVLNYYKSLPITDTADSLLKLDLYEQAIKYYKKSDSLYSTSYIKEKIALSIDAIKVENIDSSRKFIAIVFKIDSICKVIDNNKTLSEGMSEGEFINQKGGWETYDLKDEMGSSLYRIQHNISTDFYYKTSYYYIDKKVIKARMTIEDWNSDSTAKTIYNAIYYFKNDVLIKAIGENIKYSNSIDILNQGKAYQEAYYNNK